MTLEVRSDDFEKLLAQKIRPISHHPHAFFKHVRSSVCPADFTANDMIQAVFGDYFLDACVLAPRSEGRSQTMHSVALERVAFECFRNGDVAQWPAC